jgi:hypothetical protein
VLLILSETIISEKLKEAFQSIDNQISKVFKKILVLEDEKPKLRYQTITTF